MSQEATETYYGPYSLFDDDDEQIVSNPIRERGAYTNLEIDLNNIPIPRDTLTIEPNTRSHERGAYTNVEFDTRSISRNTISETGILSAINNNIDRRGGYVNVYPFAVNPDTYQPSGSVNVSRIDSATFNMRIEPPKVMHVGGPDHTVKMNALEAKSVTIDGKNVLTVVEELERELEEAKGHIQKLYDEVEKLLMYQPGSGTMYSMALTRFQTNQLVHQVPQRNTSRPVDNYIPIGTFAGCILVLLLLLSFLRFMA
uniref:Major capsid protein double jelly-roll n=1 Tax=Clandestinovirus TaxID=2831644 RepID=A0A8F8PKC8_9VIRU|nr:major capsid protein double jelly-roll [Clandestinovirus]